MEFNIQVRGSESVMEMLKGLPARIEKNALHAGLRAGCRIIAEEAKRRVPVEHGDLKAAIGIEPHRGKKGSGTIHYSVGVRYVKKLKFSKVQIVGRSGKSVIARVGRLLLKGHVINNRRTGVQTFNTYVKYGHIVEFGSGPHTIKANKKVLSDGSVVYGKEVHHPGQPAQPFLRPAFAATQDQVFRVIEDKVRSYIQTKVRV